MKNKHNFIVKMLCFGYLILSLSGCGNSGPQQNGPGEVPPDTSSLAESSTNNSTVPDDTSNREGKFSKIQMVNSKEGWARSPQAVFKTENGGDNWIDVTPVDIKAQYNIQAFFFLDENCAWIMPDQETQTRYERRTIIFRTLDKGAHWEKFELSQTNIGTQLYFADKNRGWMKISQGVSLGQHPFDLYATENGGKTWDKIHSVNMGAQSSIPLSGFISGFYFIDAQTGWLTGDTNMGLPVFEQTTDGGFTWEDVEFPYQEGSIMGNENHIGDTSVKVGPPSFFNRKDGLIQVEYFYSVNNEHYSLFYYTGDGGKSWTKKDEKIAYNDSGSLQYSFVDKENGWLIADGKDFMKTVDGGTTWIPVNALSALSLKGILDIQFSDKSNGWILDENGLFRTTDSGKSWKRVN